MQNLITQKALLKKYSSPGLNLLVKFLILLSRRILDKVSSPNQCS